MAANANSAFSICRVKSNVPFLSSSSSSTLLPLHFVRFQSVIPAGITTSYSNLSAATAKRKISRTRMLKAVAEEAEEQLTLVPEGESEAPAPTTTVDHSVSVQVSPSDVLNMFFRAEGTMNEAAIPTVTKALEETEGITDLKVQVLEGIARVNLTKQTTVQSTGVASGLVEKIRGSGFKLQTLSLSFQDDEDIS